MTLIRLKYSVIPVALLCAPVALGCSSSQTPTEASAQSAEARNPAADPSAEHDTTDDTRNAHPDKPNIVFILTDDLSWNLVDHMSEVKRMQQNGTTFSHYFVTDSLCCPSRSSIFTGKYPHDTTVFVNKGDHGGYPQFERAGNANQTFAVSLSGAGYETAMSGKYLNLYEPTTDNKDPGWSDWFVAGDAYHEYKYDLNENGRQVYKGKAPDDYLVDVQAKHAVEFIHKHAEKPFMMEVATFAPHAPYVPADRYKETYHGGVPESPSFDKENRHPPRWLAERKKLDQADLNKLDHFFNKRVEAVQAVDDLIAGVFRALREKHLEKTTYVIFSSDNGYHLGEHMMFAGKKTAFDTDIRVPLVVVGPNVPPGAVDDRIVENIDLCPTFADLAGTRPANADGHSLLRLFHGDGGEDWRNVTLVEHRGHEVSPLEADDPDNDEVMLGLEELGEAEAHARGRGHGPSPNSYEAIRMHDALFVDYNDGETEYYDLKSDPNEMDNIAETLSAERVKSLRETVGAIKNCHSTDDCWKAQHR